MLLIYVSNLTPRVKYTMELFFNEVIATPWKITTNLPLFKEFLGPKLNYSERRIDQEFYIEASPLLFEENIYLFNISIDQHNNIPIIFTIKDKEANLPFDPFAASFYLVSRYEEYIPFKGDHHGRFTAKESFSFKNNFLHLPVVNLWAEILKSQLKSKFPNLSFSEKKYKYHATIDIDNAYAFLDKGWARTIGACAKNIFKFNTTDIKWRLKTIKTRKNDPYDTYNHLFELEKKYNLRHMFFFLLGNYGKFDRNIHFKNRNFRGLIQNISKNHSIGIHPSFKSNSTPNLVDIEMKRLSNIVSQPVKNSRQHFLMINLPKTYNTLIQSGISEDYSMGYADEIGFRAGIASPFNFFNLQKNESTNLKIHPFQVMEATLKNYMQLSPESALEEIKKIISTIKNVNGTFTTLWHNETLSDAWEWKGWKKLYEEVIKEAVE